MGNACHRHGAPVANTSDAMGEPTKPHLPLDKDRQHLALIRCRRQATRWNGREYLQRRRLIPHVTLMIMVMVRCHRHAQQRHWPRTVAAVHLKRRRCIKYW